MLQKTWKVPQHENYPNHKLQTSAHFAQIKLKFFFALRLSLKMGIESLSISQHYLYDEDLDFFVRTHRWLNHTELRWALGWSPVPCIDNPMIGLLCEKQPPKNVLGTLIL